MCVRVCIGMYPKVVFGTRHVKRLPAINEACNAAPSRYTASERPSFIEDIVQREERLAEADADLSLLFRAARARRPEIRRLLRETLPLLSLTATTGGTSLGTMISAETALQIEVLVRTVAWQLREEDSSF